MLADRLKKLRATIEVQAEMCLSQIDAALAELETAPKEPEALACPECGETDEEKLEDTTEMGSDRRTRLTCLRCGKSFYPMEMANG